MTRIYLDANATEPLRPEARAAVLAAYERTGNPSSVHAFGRSARRLLEDSRDEVAARLGAAATDLVFTSGGTEANALAIHALGAEMPVLFGATEHDAVREVVRHAESLPVDPDGVIDLGALSARLRNRPALVCLMLANNETGVIHPIRAAADICHAAGGLLHVDAVQAAGRMRVDFAALGADSLAVSSHKLGGPAGCGALILAAATTRAPRALFAGGGQERGWRGGTPPVAAVAGFAAAMQRADCAASLDVLRDRIERSAMAEGAVALGAGAPRLGNTVCLGLPGVRADAQVIALDLAGVCVSAGSACSSGKVSRSHVLEAMGCGRLAGEAIRVSLPWNVTNEDVLGFIAAYHAMAERMSRSAA